MFGECLGSVRVPRERMPGREENTDAGQKLRKMMLTTDKMMTGHHRCKGGKFCVQELPGSLLNCRSLPPQFLI